MALPIFFPSVSGLDAQSHALGTVSQNIANINTTGYKSTDTQFFTLLGTQPTVKSNASGLNSSRADIHGVGYYDRTNITQQGVIGSTGRNYDVAINTGGNAFFVLRDVSGDAYYTRAGDFQIKSENDIPYLISKNGLYLQGFPANSDGTFSPTLQDIKIDYPNRVPSQPTTKIDITANVPADGVETSAYGMTVYGPNNDGRAMNMIFTKVGGMVNAWDVSFNMEDGVASTANPLRVQFDTDGQIVSPKKFDIAVNWNDGSANNVRMDISTMTQYTGSSGLENIFQDGKPSGNFIEGYIDVDGIVKARYGNGVVKDYAKIALTSFVAPENLTPISGTMFQHNADAGAISYVVDANTPAKTVLVSQALERSTSNVEQDFADMVVIQRAYTMNAKSFTTANEMTEVAVNLKT